MQEYRNIRISKSTLTELKSMQCNEETLTETIKRLTSTCSEWIECIWVPRFDLEYYSDDSAITILIVKFYGVTGEEPKYIKYEFKKEPTTEVLRLPKSISDEWEWMRVHPDETYNTTLFKVICINKALVEWGEVDRLN